MRRRRIIQAFVGLLVILGVYVGVFSYWWFQNPVTTKTLRGRQVRIVQFRFNAFSWHTRLIWQPAFWFVEHVRGYEMVGYAAMEKDSVIEYLK